MSASEKLRALREVPYNTALSHHRESLTEEEHQAGVSAIAVVFGALPLIADVVEAAEFKVGHETKYGEHWYPSSMSECPLCDARSPRAPGAAWAKIW